MLSIVILKDKVDALTLASVIYYANLVSNVIFAFVRYGEEKLFAYGLLLFAMCDLCIGLDVLFSDYLKSEVLSAVFRFPYANVPWIFYQPSQALIAMRLYQKIKT